jgi:hypothetical protein
LGAYRLLRYAVMIELVSALSIRINRCEGDDPIREPFGSDPAPITAVSGLIVALSATLRSRVWCSWGMGSRVELSSESDKSADNVSRTLPRSMSVRGGFGSGKAGEAGGESIEASETRLP